MKLLPIILFVFSFNCLAQDFVGLYKDYLPEVIASNNTYSEQINASFKAYSSINPNLIYYYALYLQQKLNDNYGGDYFFKNFPVIRKMYEAEYNERLKQLKNKIIEKAVDNTLTNLCVDYVDDYINEDVLLKRVPDIDSNTDENLLNYFVVKYYSGDALMKYDQSFNYETSRKEIEQKKISGFRDMQNNPESYSKGDLRDVILNMNIIDNNKSYGIDAASIIVSVMEHYYDSNKLFSGIEVGTGFSFHNDYMFTGDFTYDTPLYSGSDVERKFQMSSLFLSVKYKFALSKYYSLFNMINVRAAGGYGLINHNIEGEKIGFWNKGNVDGIRNRSEIFEFSANTIKLKNAGYAQADITIPVFYFKEFLSIDLGGGVNFLFTSYEVTYQYEYRKYESEFLGAKIITKENGSGTDKKMTTTVTRFFPVAQITLYPVAPFLIHMIFDLHAGSIEMGLML